MTEQGKMVTLSRKMRNPAIETRFRIFPDRLYRVEIKGTRDSLFYDGWLQEIRLHTCPKGFVLDYVELRDGISHIGFGGYSPFDRMHLLLRDEPNAGFGRLLDVDGFRKRRESGLLTPEGGVR